MAVVALFQFPGQPVSEYDRGMSQDTAAKQHQPERLVHVCYETDDGWAVLDVWESPEALARFGEVLGLPPDQRPKVYPVHNLIQG